MVREVHFAWDGDNGVETTLVRAADRHISETHDWDLGEFADAIPLTAPAHSAQPARSQSDEPAESPVPTQSERRKRRRRSGDESKNPKRHLAGANWLAYMPAAGKPNAFNTSKAAPQADAER